MRTLEVILDQSEITQKGVTRTEHDLTMIGQQTV